MNLKYAPEQILSDINDMYSHESHVLITTIENKGLLLIAYASDKVTATEGKLTEHKILKIYELTTRKFLQSFDLFYAGLTAGLTMPADIPATAIRMYVTGTTLVLYAGNNNTSYKRTIDITSSDPTSWAPSNISVAQMTMKDANGDDVLADVTSANIQTHLNYVFGDAYAGYASLMPLFRNGDIAKNGNNWYATLECSSERSHGLGSPTLLLTSTDAGNTWSFGSPIGYTTSLRLKLIETAIFFIGSDLHTLSRGTSVLHFKSTDNGETWVAQLVLPLSVMSSKPCAINYINANSEQKNVMAITLASELDGNPNRTTLGIYATEDFSELTEVAKYVTPTYCHYPSLCYYNNHLYMSYTKGIPEGSTTDRNAIGFVMVF